MHHGVEACAACRHVGKHLHGDMYLEHAHERKAHPRVHYIAEVTAFSRHSDGHPPARKDGVNALREGCRHAGTPQTARQECDGEEEKQTYKIYHMYINMVQR